MGTSQQDGGSTTESPPPTQKLSPKIENVHPLQPDNIFSSLSEKELDDLTTLNTVKNEKYLSANITVVVIRMEGERKQTQGKLGSGSGFLRKGDEGLDGDESVTSDYQDPHHEDWKNVHHDHKSHSRKRKSDSSNHEGDETRDPSERPFKRVKFEKKPPKKKKKAFKASRNQGRLPTPKSCLSRKVEFYVYHPDLYHILM